jgi:hypothetical protein
LKTLLPDGLCHDNLQNHRVMGHTLGNNHE